MSRRMGKTVGNIVVHQTSPCPVHLQHSPYMLMFYAYGIFSKLNLNTFCLNLGASGLWMCIHHCVYIIVYTSCCIHHCVRVIAHASLCMHHCARVIAHVPLRTRHCARVIAHGSLCTGHCAHVIAYTSLCIHHCVYIIKHFAHLLIQTAKTKQYIAILCFTISKLVYSV